MKFLQTASLIFLVVSFTNCNQKQQKSIPDIKAAEEALSASIPVDRGFSRYIASYTSGVIPASSGIEIQFTPEFAAKADKTARGIFEFTPAINGKTEWKDDVTLIFTPAKPLDPGKIYSGKLNLSALAGVEDNLKVFPIRLQTLRKDFRVSLGAPESLPDGGGYNIRGQVSTTDHIDPGQLEKCINIASGKEKHEITWEHPGGLSHIFTVKGIRRENEEKQLTISWDGKDAGVKQKGSSSITIPASGEFTVIDILTSNGTNQRIDIILSDPVDPSQDLTGLVQLSQQGDMNISSSLNTISVLPVINLEGNVDIRVEPTLRNQDGKTLNSAFTRQLDFSQNYPAILLEGNGVILPASKDLIFPFKAVNLNAVDLTIIKIFENNLPYFLQESDINGGYSLKRFGRPVYSGKIDLVITPGTGSGSWNLYTIDLSDYIDVEPGVLYKVTLSMRKSYSLYPCEESEEAAAFDQLLQEAEQRSRDAWDDPDVYYDDPLDEIYYSAGFDWEDSDNPCKNAYYSPDRKKSRNVLASNLGIIAKRGDDKILHVIVNDLLSALPVKEAAIDVFDYQLQKITSGTTNQDGDAAMACDRLPFLIIATKDKDRNYLKTTEGSSLSLSSFEVSGTMPENGIKAFIYGERDVWRPGDSIFLSLLIKDMKNTLARDHPVLFELINPMEQRIDNQVLKSGGSDLLIFKTLTSPDAVTGNYRAVFTIGGAVFTKRIRVETIKPNRLRIDLGFGKEILGGSDPYSEGSLKVQWLNGAIAKNLNSSVEYILRQSKTEFKKYPDYIFDDPSKEFYSETVKVFDGRTDENGNATVVFNPSEELNAPGMLNAVFTATAAEPGGDESITRKTYQYAPYRIFAGISFPGLKDRMLYTDEDNELKIVTVDETGKAVDSRVEVSVYKLTYRWWWESDQENLGYYISNNTYKPVITNTVQTSGGTASWKFKIDKEEWGRYLVRVTAPSGHSTGKIILVDWPWEYGMKYKTDGATLISVSTDKESYDVGDDVSLSFPSPENARAIVTLENSAGVIDEIRTGTGKGSTVIKFRTLPAMAPNVYAYVTIIQPHDQTINDMPVRLYGIVPVMVEDPETRLSPVVNMPDELRSVNPFVVKVNEKNNKPMTYTLALVDEGLLDITGFKTPDPWNYFYAKEALGVKTWDLYDNVLGAFGGTIERILAPGGDEALEDKAAGKARRFIPVVKFLGPFNLQAGKTNSHSITLPQYTGSIRTMVVAGGNRAYGFSEKSVPVKDPLMVLVTAPRVVSPSEEVSLPVSLFVQKEGIREVKLSASGDNVSFDKPGLTIPITSVGETNTRFSFRTGQKTGVAKIKIDASSGGETASYSMEIDIRSPNPPETRSDLKILNKGEKWQTGINTFGMEGTNSAVLEISSIPSINLEKKLEFLISYPHGCSEQTTSAAFPQLYLKNIRNNDPRFLQKISDNVRHAINVIAARQMAGGGIAMWPGAYQPDSWITSYTGHFMIEAEKNGYSIPSGFRKKWVNFQSRLANEWRHDQMYSHTMNDQAYRLFTLALAGDPERGAMNRLRELKDLPQLSRWLLSAAFALSGRPEAAQDLLDVRNTTTEPEYRWYYYGSELRDRSVILYALSILKNQEAALPVLKEVCDRFNNTSWYSTQDASWALIGYMKFMEMMQGSQGSESKIAITLNGESSEHSVRPEKLDRTDLKINEGNNSLVVSNSSDRPVYVTLTRKGVPLSTDATAVRKGLSMIVNYFDLQIKPLDHTALKQGQDFLMVVQVTNNTYSRVENIALTQMTPSGWEIRNTRLFEAEYGIKDSDYEYRDFRDDRINTYFSLGPGKSAKFVAILNAAYTGVFQQPSVWCEAMYTPDIYARMPGGRVKVTEEEFE